MEFLDWAIIAALLGFMTYMAYRTRVYNRTVADFLAANRCAGRYMLGVSDGIANVGAISIIMVWEMYYKAGFSVAWWALVMLVVQVIVALTGWVAYRYRQSRALTLAQLLEMRYNKSFRVFCGVIIFTSGLLNFGIFPAVGAKFFQYFCGLPTDIIWDLGDMKIDVVYMSIMVALLAIALYFTFAGGQITVMVTDFIQGTFFNIALCIVILFVVFKMPWSDMVEALSNKPAGESMINPFKSANTKDFNLSFYLIQALVIFWTFMAWQGAQGYFAAAKNAHEARMGRVMGNWRILTQQMLVIILPIAAFTLLHHSGWSAKAAEVNNVLDQIGNETIRTQVTTSVALRVMLPVGITGALAAVLLSAFISTHDTYLHSWGSIFIQDILLPLRKGKPLDTRAHMKWLKIAIFGVAVFIFLFSLFFSQNDTIAMYFALTGTIWLGGAGAVIVGGLYTRWGTTSGAYAAIIGGIVIAVAIFTCQRVWPDRYHTVEAGRVAHMQWDQDDSAEAGRFGGAAKFDGAAELAVEGIEGFDASRPGTISFWVKTKASGTLLSWGLPAKNSGAVIEIVDKTIKVEDEDVAVGVLKATIDGIEVFGTQNLIDDAWHQVAVITDPSKTDSQKVEVWIDGSLQAGDYRDDAAAVAVASDSVIRIAKAAEGRSAFVGCLDEMAIYDRAITRKGVTDPKQVEGNYEMAMLKGLEFPINSQWGMLWAMVSTALFYAVVSLITCRKPFNLDKLLNRGEYAREDEKAEVAEEPVRGLGTLIGMGKDFSKSDRVIYSSVTGWSVLWAVVFIGGCIYNYFINPNVTEGAWAKFWHFYVWLSVVLGVITTIWFAIGGIKDMKDLFRRLSTMQRDDSDDGSVS